MSQSIFGYYLCIKKLVDFVKEGGPTTDYVYLKFIIITGLTLFALVVGCNIFQESQSLMSGRLQHRNMQSYGMLCMKHGKTF